MADTQCRCYGKTADWCKYCATMKGTPLPTPPTPEGSQPGWIDPEECCANECCGRQTECDPCALKRIPKKLIFILEWYDRESDLVKKFTLAYYDVDKTCEIADLIYHRRFLKRHKLANITSWQILIPGNVINIYGRQMTILDYADSCTRQYLAKKQQKAFLLIRPHAVCCLGAIYDKLQSNFHVLRCRMAWFTKENAETYYQDKFHEDVSYFNKLIDHVTSAPVVAFLLVGENAVERLNEMAGDKDPAQAKLRSPMSLRSTYGKDTIQCGVEVSETAGCVIRDSAFFFTECRLLLASIAPAAYLGRCSTLCIIKPHAVRKGHVGRIIFDIVTAGFKITGLEMFYLDRTHAEEHYEIYRGVMDEFSDMTEELSLGPCIVMEVSGCGEKTPKAFRDIAGPMDPVVAKKLCPKSLRAKYGGSSKVKNAIHCTDLECDAEMEVSYFFKFLQMLE